jgi:predicted nucleic acid-binding protein
VAEASAWSRGCSNPGEKIGKAMSQATALYVLDTSAWLTLIEDEAGADVVQTLVDKARAGDVVVLVSFMSFMEVYYITLQERDEAEARARVD